jgi:hypothetical protein
MFIVQAARPYVIKLYTVIVLAKPFQHGIMFASNARAYPNGASEKVPSFRVGSCPYSQTLYKPGNAWQEQTF